MPGIVRINFKTREKNDLWKKVFLNQKKIPFLKKFFLIFLAYVTPRIPMNNLKKFHPIWSSRLGNILTNKCIYERRKYWNINDILHLFFDWFWISGITMSRQNLFLNSWYLCNLIFRYINGSKSWSFKFQMIKWSSCKDMGIWK